MRRNATAIAIALTALAAPSAAFAQDGEAPRKRVEFTPYIEAAQVISKEFSPGDDFVTYTRLAAGVDAEISGRNTEAAVSLRYERRIGWREEDPDGDLISGIARAGIGILPNKALTLEAGGLAARTRVEGNGGSILSPIVDNPGEANIYAGYAGPSVRTRVGDLQVEGHYRIGYAKVEEPDAIVTVPGQDPVDVFDESIVHNAQARVGIAPNTVLPIGVGVGGGYYQEDINNLDQRVQDRWVRGDVSVPLGPTLALVGGVGFEDVKVSNRDVLRDGLDNPVVGPDGRYVTDPNSPRQIAFETSGLIWDAGVMWRPTRRTSLEAHVGKRYGSMSYYGSLSYQPNSRASINIGVYDSVQGFGGQVTDALAALPTDFQAVRNPISGDITGCVASLEGGQCLGSVLAGVRSSTFRARGVTGTLAVKLGRWQAGVGAGYDRRKFIGAEGTILEASSGVIDENVWLAGYLNGQLGESSSISTNVYATWLNSGFDNAGSSTGYGASATYYRNITQNLSATAAVSVDGVKRDDGTVDDTVSGAALLGMRYSF